MSLFENLAAIRKRLTKATTDITIEITRARALLIAKREEIKALTRTNPPMDEIRERAAEEVKRAGAVWLAENEGKLLASVIGGELSIRTHSSQPQGLGGADPSRRIRLPWDSKGPAPWGLLCLTEPERAAAMLERAISLCPSYVPGLPVTERAEAVEAAQADLRELEAQEEQIVDEACAAGVQIEHRPEVARRRAAEESRRQDEAERRAEAEERERALNAQPHSSVATESMRARTGQSGYLASGRV